MPVPSKIIEFIFHEFLQLPTTSTADGGSELAVVIPTTTLAGTTKVSLNPQPIFVNAISKPSTSAAAGTSLIVISDQNHRNSEASGKKEDVFYSMVSWKMYFKKMQGF